MQYVRDSFALAHVLWFLLEVSLVNRRVPKEAKIRIQNMGRSFFPHFATQICYYLKLIILQALSL